MSLKNKSMYAILGILNIRPSTGYDIKKYCDRVLSGFWNENYGHIYPTLKMLLKDGMIEVVSDSKADTFSSGRERSSLPYVPAKKLSDRKICYGITEKGRQEFVAWLTAETEQQPVRSEFMLKLLFSNERPKGEIIQMLIEYREQHQKKMENYHAMLNELEAGIDEVQQERIFYLRTVLRKGILAEEATITWCNETIAELKR